MRPSVLIASASVAATAAILGLLALVGIGHAAAASYNGMGGGSMHMNTSMMGERGNPRTLRVLRPEKGAAAKVTHVRLMNGTVMRRMHATVMTDTRCSPDARGVSHCINRMRLANGMVVTAIHDHRMMDMPCLSPGEQVTLAPS